MTSDSHTSLVPLFTSLLIFVLLPGASVAKTPPPPPPLEVRSHLFSNGLSLYHVKLEEATNVMLSVTVWVGSVNEDRRVNGGVSHLLEHILFHQPDIPAREFKAQIESRGGSFNGMTSEDYTEYYVTIPLRHLELGQNWLHKVLFHDRLVTDRLEQEKEIVNRENGWSPPTWWERLWSFIDSEYLELPGFWEDKFGLPQYDQHPEGTYKTASTLTAAQLERHYRSYYYPENMVVLYAGPHGLDEVVASLNPTFGRVPPTGRKGKVSPLLETISPQPYFSHGIPGIFSDPEYDITLGYQFTGVEFSQRPELILYRSVMRQLLMERFRYGEGKTYSVSGSFRSYRGVGHLEFQLEASPETYWTQLEKVKTIVWGDPEESLSRQDYERYKMTFVEQGTSSRELWDVHERIWDVIHWHPLHRPSPEKADLYEAVRALSYEEFLERIRPWQGRTAPSLELSMPVVLFPYAHTILFAVALGIGAHLTRSLLRRPFPRENIHLSTHIPYGIAGWIHLGFIYAVVAALYTHVSWAISYGTLFFDHVSTLAMIEPYLNETTSGFLFGLWVVTAGALMPRKVLVTDGALVLRMRSPLFFRIPVSDIQSVEPVSGWTAWGEILRLAALPVYPWFLRGLIIRRKSGPSLVLHTTDDREFMRCVRLG